MSKLIAKNKDAYFNFKIEKEYEAGIVLSGNEVKSIRAGNTSLNSAFVTFKNNEAFVMNMHISEYMNNKHDPLKSRKLLLHKKEIYKLKALKEQKGISIVAMKLIFSNKGYIKLIIGVGHGKNTRDKREVIKRRDISREIHKKFKL